MESCCVALSGLELGSSNLPTCSWVYKDTSVTAFPTPAV